MPLECLPLSYGDCEAIFAGSSAEAILKQFIANSGVIVRDTDTGDCRIAITTVGKSEITAEINGTNQLGGLELVCACDDPNTMYWVCKKGDVADPQIYLKPLSGGVWIPAEGVCVEPCAPSTYNIVPLPCKQALTDGAGFSEGDKITPIWCVTLPEKESLGISYWNNETLEIITISPNDLGPCVDDCTPWVGGGTADVLPVEQITDFTLQFPPQGCNGTISTTLGDVPFFMSQEQLTIPRPDCNYSIISVTADCPLNEIIWYASRNK